MNSSLLVTAIAAISGVLVVVIIVYAWRDATSRGRAIVELARTNTELARRLAERTIERDDVARNEALTQLMRTNVTQAFLEQEFAREHRASAAFQEAALPSRLPVVAGLQFGAIYRAANAEARVGGDWYDAFRLDDGRIVVSVGDVMGNGLIAAVTMGAVRQALRGAAQILAEPVAILDAADRVLHSEQPNGIVTALIGVIDMKALTFTFASAGHPPPFLRSADGSIATLEGSGLPLGLRAMDASPELPRVVALHDAALIVLYTDGLIESTRDADAGEARVRAALARADVWTSSNPAEAIGDHVLDDVVDDVAILSIRLDVHARLATATTAITASSGSPALSSAARAAALS